MKQGLNIKIVPSPETNDHEVLLFGNGHDIIRSMDKGMMGLDPDDILQEPSSLHSSQTPHMTTIARCTCGVIGCGSIEAEVKMLADVVVWTVKHYSKEFRFDARQYEAELKRAISDTSWETPDRTAARLIRALVDRGTLAANRFQFSWASGRVRDGRMTIALRLDPGPYQVLVHSSWGGRDPEGIAKTLCRTLLQQPSTWSDVEYYPQGESKGAPLLAGPGWRLGTG